MLILSQETEEVIDLLLKMVSSEYFIKNSEFSIALLPFLSSIGDGWSEVYNKYGIVLDLPDIEGIPFEKLLKKTRVGYKLYTDKKNNKATKLLNEQAKHNLY